MRGGEMLRAAIPAAVADQQMVDMRALPYDENCGYVFNGSIAARRIQYFYPVQAVADTNVITYDLAPTGAPADYYDLYNSHFRMDWTWVYTADYPTEGQPFHIGTSLGLYHTLLLFPTQRIFINGVECNDETNNLQHFADFHKILVTQPFTPLPQSFGNNLAFTEGFAAGATPSVKLDLPIQ